MKAMISQPMRGKTEEQIKKEREEIVKELYDKGYVVLDTIFKQAPPKNCDGSIWYLAKSIETMSIADCVVFMQGWENARGCIIEHEVAKRYDKFIKYL